MTALRCLLVDDERLARSNLRALLAAHEAVSIAGEAASVKQAEESIRLLRPDLVFLDIQLPDGDGFQLLERLGQPPRVIFVTAYDRYAVRAFEVNALDYLLKPVDPARLDQALTRLAPDRPPQVLPPAPPPFLADDAMLIPAGQSGYFIRISDILTVTVDGNYTTALTVNGKTHTVLDTLTGWEKRLPPALFLRVDRTQIVNLRQIHTIEPLGRHVVLELGLSRLRIELRRAAADRIRQVFQNEKHRFGPPDQH